MTVTGKYQSRFAPERLWFALLSADAIRYAVPEIEQLDELDQREAADIAASSLDVRVWQGRGSLPGAGDLGMVIATIRACDLQPYTSYTLQVESKIGALAINAIGQIALSPDEQRTDTNGTLIRWDANVLDAVTGRSHVMFEWMAGIMAQHFFRQIDQYLTLSQPGEPISSASDLSDHDIL